MTPVTVWQKLGASGFFEHNHIEEGHSTSDKPRAIEIKGAKWRKQYAFRDENNKIHPYRT